MIRLLGLVSLLLWNPVTGQIRADGVFQSKSNGIQASGGFRIIEEAGSLTLHLLDGFKVSSGPDLYFVLNPADLGAATDNNAKTNALRIEPKLKKLTGVDTYAIPAGTDLSQYKSLLIHCWQFNHLYAGAALNLTPSTALLRVPVLQKTSQAPIPLFDILGKRLSPSSEIQDRSLSPAAGMYFQGPIAQPDDSQAAQP